MMQTCPACGLPVDERCFGDPPPLTDIKLRILRLIRSRPGISGEELTDSIYAGRGDGGPESGRKLIHVHVNQINKQLMRVGSRLRVRGSRWDGYRVVRKGQ